MEIFRKKGEKALADQCGVVPCEAVDALSFSQCHVPFARLEEFTGLQKLKMISMTPQLRDFSTFPFKSIGSFSVSGSLRCLSFALRKLDVSDNKITALDAAVFYLPNLEQMILTNNLLATVNAFAPALVAGCPKLTWLDVAMNPVEVDLNAKEKEISFLPSGTEGGDGGDNLAEGRISHYRSVIFAAVPTLTVLDGCDANGVDVDDVESDEDVDDEYTDSDYEEDGEEDEEAEGDEDVDGCAPPTKAHRSE